MSAQLEVVRWTAPGLEARARAGEGEAVPPHSVEELQAIEQAAHDEGFARGHAEGLASGQAEVRRMVAQMEGILDGFTRPLARLDAEVADALAELAVRVAGALIGRAYVADPALLAELVQQALDTLGGTTREVELRLHPDDLGVLAPHLAALDGVRLVADTSLARGELRLHGESVRIDGTLAARLQSALQAILDASESAK
ncbi:MAG TPA: FliH/SctL family protein [Xanthomonadaceae bacterium]|nr:FliH/SctL family protein [Xanthomonadaceae bacterium]